MHIQSIRDAYAATQRKLGHKSGLRAMRMKLKVITELGIPLGSDKVRIKHFC